MKHALKARYYLRYMDDFILLDRSKERLLEMKEGIKAFLTKRLDLEFKPQFTLKRVSGGADFLGYIVRPGYVLVRNRVAGNLKSRLEYFRGKMVADGAIGRNKFKIIHMREEIINNLRQILASCLGHFKHANAHNLIERLFERYCYLKYLFALDRSDKLVPLYEPSLKPSSLREQYHWFSGKFNNYCLFFQIGRFCEFYGPQAEKYAPLFGVKPGKETRGMGKQCGFPVRLLKVYKRRALLTCQPYIVVAERGYYPTGLKRRLVTEILIF